MELSNSLKENLVYILKKLVQIPTENPPGKTEEIVNFLITEVFKQEDGFHNEVITHIKNNIELHNLITRIGYGKKKLILSGHFDVVPIGDMSKWIYPPFSAKIVNGKLYGRGSADMKGGITSLIGIMQILSTNADFMEDYELIFLGTADEEAAMSGSFTLSERGYTDDAHLLIVAEPTDLNIGIAEKGLLWGLLKIYGKSAHGSMPSEGINAIEGALEIIPQLYDCVEDRINKILGKPTLNIGKIKGGTKINVVPDYAQLEVDFRLIPEQRHENIINKLNSIKSEYCKIEVDILKNSPALQTDLNHLFIQNLRKIANSEYIGLSYATDAVNYVSSNKSIPFVIFGPGNPTNIHKENEWVSLNQVFKSTEYLNEALLKTYFK